MCDSDVVYVIANTSNHVKKIGRGIEQSIQIGDVIDNCMIEILLIFSRPLSAVHNMYFKKVNTVNVIKSVLNGSLVSVSGAPGVGKSALLAGTCQYLAARGVFKGGIIFVRLGDRAVTQSRFFELIEDALVQQSEAVEAAHRPEEEERGGFRESVDSSLNHSDRSSAASEIGNRTPSLWPPLPHPRVSRANDVAALEQHEDSQADTDADREAWIIESLQDRSALLVVDQDTLFDEGKNSMDSDDEEEGGGLRGFLSRLFDGVPHMKVLLASSRKVAHQMII